MNRQTLAYILLKLVTLAWVTWCCFCSAAAHGQGRCYRLPNGRVVCEETLTPERSPGYVWVRPVQPTQQVASAKYGAIVKISADELGNVQSWTSGTIVDRDETGAYVVTNSHLLDDWRGGPITVFVSGHPYTARLLGRDPAIDASLLKIQDPGVDPIPAGEIVSGESHAGGYPHARNLRWVPGRFVRYAEMKSRNAPGVWSDTAVFSGGVSNGVSGGPIVQNGKLVAIVWGSEGGETYGIPIRLVRRIFSRLVPCWRRRAGVVSTQPNPPPVLPGPGPPPEPPDEPLVPIVEVPPNPQGLLAEVNARLDKLEALIAAIPAGAKGDRGDKGDKGDTGDQGPAVDLNALSLHIPHRDMDALAAKVAARLPPLPVRRLYMKRKGTPDPPVPVPADDTEWVPYHEDVDEVNWIDGEGLTIRTFPPN